MKQPTTRLRWVGPALLVLVVSGFTGLGVLTMPSARADGVPYNDSSAVGTIGLCDATGRLVTSGNIHDHPFVVTAVSSERGPSPYDGKGGKATLLAYQPREGVVPGRWSGDTLTGASVYTNPAHPMAAATARDFSLADFLDEFPARWDGLVQLRMYLGAPDAPVLKLPYASTDLRVTGDTWTVVRGGTGDCSAGKAVSNEIAVFGTAAPSPSGSGSHGPSGSASSSPHGTGSPGPSGSATSTQTSSTTPVDATAPDDHHVPIVAGGVAVVVLALGALAFSWWRERDLRF